MFYITSMWVAGIMQGLMWKAYTEFGFLEYSFVESVSAMHVYYIIRALGGGLFLFGALIMAFNLYMTVKGKGAAEALDGDVPIARRPAIAGTAVPAAGE